MIILRILPDLPAIFGRANYRLSCLRKLTESSEVWETLGNCQETLQSFELVLDASKTLDYVQAKLLRRMRHKVAAFALAHLDK
jgi:hypothetical protein